MTEKASVLQMARFLALLGGIVVILWGVLELSKLAERGSLPSIGVVISVVAYGILGIVLGLVSVAGSKFMNRVPWSILLVVVGILAFSLGLGFPWYLGTVLVVLSGLAGIVGRLA